MRINVNEARCQGHTLCNAVAPDIFQLRDEDGHAFVVSEAVPPELEELARRAALGCPEQAIEIDDD